MEVLNVHFLFFFLDVLLEGVLLLLVLGIRFTGIVVWSRLVTTPDFPWILLHCSALVGLDRWQTPSIFPGIPPVILDVQLERLQRRTDLRVLDNVHVAGLQDMPEVQHRLSPVLR